ncbi:uncharacterized protein LOC124259406 [Haliotis rubra]|uniref:uncharacterized protein LOC124259406 n=1 Tax=Haliotis rubra TaxID=36100 RepID=UPI001EE51412|nr:uncharacterized protein LOC124259406 [Haliotis rubra]
MATLLDKMPQSTSHFLICDQKTSTSIDIPERQIYGVKWDIYIDITYCKSIHGILNAAITVVSLIGWVSSLNGVISRDSGSGHGFYEFVSGSVFFSGIVSYFIYSIVIHKNIRFNFDPCKDMMWYSVWSVLYFIASNMVENDKCDACESVAVFGYTAGVLCIAKVMWSYKAWHHDRFGGCPDPAGRAAQLHVLQQHIYENSVLL